MRDRSTPMARILSLLAAFVATAVVLGLLAAGLVMPAVGFTGASARQAVHMFDALPGEFKQTPLSQQSRILAADGSLIATPYDENRIIVPLSQIAPIMRQAQVAIEDSRFYQHGGVDLHGIARAFVSNLNGGGTQGASTLTQQYVKITLQENALRAHDTQAAQAATAKNYSRKIQELKYAVTLEKTLTKDQILEGYFNLVYYGDQAYGIEAAARHYFDVHAAQLSLPQAALLAGLVQQPSATDPVHNPKGAVARRNVVLDRMHELGLISDTAWTKAKATKLKLHLTSGQNSCANSPYPYFCDYVVRWLMQQPALGQTTAERANRINRGGLTIQTSLDPKIVAAVDQEITKRVPIGNPERIGAAAAVVEPGTGKVLAIGQNTNFLGKKGFGTNQVDWAVDKQYGESGGFQIGSTAKMFAVADALKSGMPVNAKIYAKPATATQPALFFPSEYADRCRSGVPFAVRNDEGSAVGRITLIKAAADSINTAFAGLVAKLGVCSVRDLMTQMGLHQASGAPFESYPAPVTLGADPASPLTVASAYATLAAGGKYCVPTPVVAITTSDHQTLALPKKQCRQVLDPNVANGTTEILTHVLSEGTAQGNELADHRPAAGKTGTTDKSNETWFTGYTPQLATSVWIGTPDDPGNKRALRNLKLGSTFYPGQVFGATIAAPTWKAIMDRASAGLPIVDFGQANDKTRFGDQIVVPDVSGLAPDAAVTTLNAAGFTGVIGNSVSSSVAKGLVAYSSPGSGTRIARGTTVVVYPSSGPAPTPTATPKPSPTTTKPTPSPTTPSAAASAAAAAAKILYCQAHPTSKQCKKKG